MNCEYCSYNNYCDLKNSVNICKSFSDNPKNPLRTRKKNLRAYAKKHHKNRGRCEKCGVTENLTQHHVDGNIENMKKSNLQTLCVDCHEEAEGIIRKIILDKK